MTSPPSRRTHSQAAVTAGVAHWMGFLMPGHFTHIYTARRVADLLTSGEFTDWPQVQGHEILAKYPPQFCGEVMARWEKYAAVGAIGPDLFFFSQDWSNDILGPRSDLIMLGLASYYYFDAAAEDDWEPLLVILAEVDSTMAGILRFLIKLNKIWQDFVKGWNATIGPFVDAVGDLVDDLTGGILSSAKTVLEEFLLAVKNLGEEWITDYAGIWDMMNTVVQKGYPEENFLWSDMLHYRRTSAMCQALVAQAEKYHDGTETGGDQFQQFFAFALGSIVHVGTDTIAHSFVNEQCGGPYRDHPTRHHLIENHIDAWNYRQGGPDGTIPADPWARTDDYPDLSMSALWFMVQLTPDDPAGKQRPALTGDPDTDKAALDVDGEMPNWLSEGIVAALIDAFEGHPHPTIYHGDAFQSSIDAGLLTQVVKGATGHGLDGPFQQVLDGIAPPPPFAVPKGFPLPWEVATAYRLMITLYKLNFSGSWELSKPRKPDFVIVPPLSDFTNLAQPPDFSGIDSSNPVEDVCDVFIALVEWVVREISDAINLIGDLIKMLLSPGTYLIRLGLYELAMKIWDVAQKTHNIMAHTGIHIPHGEQRYADDGELRLPNEIDLPLITLGETVDGAFLAALGDAIDPFGNLDQNTGVIVSHSVHDPNYPYYPVTRYRAGHDPEGWEYHRPWAYPSKSEFTTDGDHDTEIPNPTELYNPYACDPSAVRTDGEVSIPITSQKPTRPGPYREGTRPDQVFFRTGAGHDARARFLYEHAQTPWQTDLVNERLFGRASKGLSPLGDPVPFSAYLIGQLANPTGYATQFNLDADRAYAYLTWDWIRDPKGAATTKLGVHFTPPVVSPQLAELPNTSGKWDQSGQSAMQLHYVDPPPPGDVIGVRPGLKRARKTTARQGARPAARRTRTPRGGQR